ncbi:MAG: flippase [Gracilibacteraceae bacterium]|nr:flippase [Gracilibacteraceae bacterium]
MNIAHIAGNAAALTVSNILAKIVTAVVAIFLTRYLGPDAYGSYTIALTYAGVFIVFAELGLSQLMVQEGSRRPAVLPVYFGNALLAKTILVALAYVLMLVLMRPIGYSGQVRGLIVFAGLGAGVNAVCQSVYNYYQAVERMAAAALYQLLTAFLLSAASLFVILAALSVRAVLISQFLVYLGVAFLLAWTLRDRIHPRPDLGALPDMARRALPFGLHRMFYYIYLQMSVLLLSFSGATSFEVGIYAAPYRLVQLLLFIPSTLTSALYPILYQQGADDRDAHRRTTEKLCKVLVGVGLPGSVLLSVLAAPFIRWLFGEGFSPSAPVLVLVSWLLALECLSFSLGDALTTTNRQSQRMAAQGAGLLALVLFMPAGYRLGGLTGIAVVVLAVETLLFFLYYTLVRRNVYPIRLWRQLPAVAAAALVMAAAAFLLRGWHPLAASALAGCLYLVQLACTDADFRLLGGLLRRRRPKKP